MAKHWRSRNGVTAGCNPPANDEFCPSDNVTREQMSAFMRRLDSNNVFTTPEEVNAAVASGSTGPIDADTLDGKESTDFLESGLDSMLPTARFDSGNTGADDDWHAPVTGAPSANWDGAKWVVDLPGFTFNINSAQADCTAVGSGDETVAISSVGGDMLVHTENNGATAQVRVQCSVYANWP